MKGAGLLRRFLGRSRAESLGSDRASAPVRESALDLADIQGFILRGYRMPMVRHFLLTVGAPAAARRQLGRLVNGDESDVPQITTAADWHVGFAPGPGDDPTAAPRCKPDYCLNIGITWPGSGRPGARATRPIPGVQVVWRVRRRSRATRGARRRDWTKLAPELERWFRKGGRSRPGDAARAQPGGNERLQRQVECLVCRRGRLSRNLAPGRDGANGDAGWPSRADVQDSLRIHRRDHLSHHPRRPGAISSRSPAALRTVVVRPAGGR